MSWAGNDVEKKKNGCRQRIDWRQDSFRSSLSHWNLRVWFIGYSFRRGGINAILFNPNEFFSMNSLAAASRGRRRKLEFANILMRKLQVLNSHLRGTCFKTTFLLAISSSHASFAFQSRIDYFSSYEIVSTKHRQPLSHWTPSFWTMLRHYGGSFVSHKSVLHFSNSFIKQTLIYCKILYYSNSNSNLYYLNILYYIILYCII